MFSKTPFNASTGESVRTTAETASSSTMVDYRVMVSVQGGLHRGAAFVSELSESVFVGGSPECDLVLMDEGVPQRALCFFVKDRRLVATVMSPGVCMNGEQLSLGANVFETPAVLMQIGGATLRVEMLRRSRRRPGASATRCASGRPARSQAKSPRNQGALLAWGGLSLVIALAVGTGGVNASFNRNAQQATRTLHDLVASFNMRGAQITVGTDVNGRALLRGLVADDSMRDTLERDLNAAGLQAELQLHDVRQMGESLTRLARLKNHSCEAHHLGDGRFACDAGKASQQAAQTLRALATQVPGVVALEVRVVEDEVKPLPVVVMAPEPEAVKVPVAPPLVKVDYPTLPVIRHIAVGQHERFAVDSNGRKLRVGDITHGAKVVQIRFETVELSLAGQSYMVAATPMLTRAPD